MNISSEVLGTYIISFKDASIDHAYGDALCNILRLDSESVSRASYFSDYDSHKLEVVLVHPSADPKLLVRSAIAALITEATEILQDLNKQ